MYKIQIQRNMRRILEMRWSRNSQKKFVIAGLCLIILFIYFFLWSSSHVNDNLLNKCAIDQMTRFSNFDSFILTSKHSVSFAGNGFIGIDAALDQQLLVSSTNDSLISKLIYTSFYPLVKIKTTFQNNEEFQFVSDYRKGVSRGVKCFVLVFNFNFLIFRKNFFLD